MSSAEGRASETAAVSEGSQRGHLTPTPRQSLVSYLAKSD